MQKQINTAKILSIGGREISENTECFFVAEIGHNHQGSLKKCKELFLAAKNAGASAVKLQKRDNSTLYTQEYFHKPYLSKNAYGPTYGTHREALEFSMTEYQELINYAKEIGILFFATPFDLKSAYLLKELNFPAYKIASGDITNHPLINHVSSFNKPIIISTGGATITEIKEAVEIVMRHHEQIAILQCTASYPAKEAELNLSVIQTYKNLFPNAVIGYSGHDLGTTMSLAAFSIGARIIEKHFTLDKSLPGSDHKLSLCPEELEYLVNELKRLHLALGNGEKTVFQSEREALIKMRKKIVASQDLVAGHTIKPEDLLIKSPGNGISPSQIYKILGRKIKTQINKEETIKLDQLI